MVASHVCKFTCHVFAVHESSFSRSIFDLIGFPLKSTGATDEMALQPADIDPSTPEGRRTRAKLLRAWVELNSYIATFYRSKPSEYLHSIPSPTDLLRRRVIWRIHPPNTVRQDRERSGDVPDGNRGACEPEYVLIVPQECSKVTSIYQYPVVYCQTNSSARQT